jgi:hypothetical protein
LPAPELQVPLWVQLLASTTVVTAPNSFDMAVHLLGSTTGQTTRRRSQQQTGSVSSQRGSLFSTCSSPTQSLPVLLRNTSGRFSIDTVLDVASLIGRELAVVPDVTDFCDPRPEPKRVANARKMIREALDRAKAMETIRGQFVADLIVEERRSRPEKVPTTFVLRH